MTSWSRQTPMGDMYIVSKAKDRHWYTSSVQPIVGKARLCCHGTPLKWVADDYFHDIVAAQLDALSGKNPFVSKDYAMGYKLYATLYNAKELGSTHDSTAFATFVKHRVSGVSDNVVGHAYFIHLRKLRHE